jgi:hypothetical protein
VGFCPCNSLPGKCFCPLHLIALPHSPPLLPPERLPWSLWSVNNPIIDFPGPMRPWLYIYFCRSFIGDHICFCLWYCKPCIKLINGIL